MQIANDSDREPQGEKREFRDFGDVARCLWQGKWIIAAALATSTILATMIAISMPDVYRAETLLVPTDQGTSGDLATLSARYSGLAQLAGINLQNDSNNRKTIGLAVLQSRSFISYFVDKHKILVPLFAAKGWDRVSRELIIDDRVFDEPKGQWMRDVAPPRSAKPSLDEAYDVFADLLAIEEISGTSLVSVSLEFYSPELANDWLHKLVSNLNDYVRRKDVRQAQQALAYLREQQNATTLVEIKNVLSGLIEEQTKTLMLAHASNEYLFTILDPATVPIDPVRPRRLLLIAIGSLVGLSVGALFVLAFRRKVVKIGDGT